MSARAAYEAARRQARSKAGEREERGLPHHPDGTGRVDCPECEGAGEVMDATFDPQDECPAMCGMCAGLGHLDDGVRDPLRDVRAARLMRRYSTFDRMSYALARKRAMRPVLGQLRMIEAAIRCDVASRDAVAAWRRVA